MKNKFSRCFFALVLLLAATFAFSQGSTITGNPVVTSRSGQPISGASVAVSSTNPCGSSPTYTNCGGSPVGAYTGTLPPSNLVSTSTDVTLATPCTVSPITLGPLSGSGCTNPGHTDGLGNVVAFSSGGIFFCTYYGSGLTASVQVCPFPPPTAAIYATPGESVAHAVSRLPASGGTIVFAAGTYPSGGVTISTPGITLQGAGMPSYNSATAPTALTGPGTIIQGPIQVIQGGDHFVIRDMGCDTGSTWTNANNGGVPVSCLAIFNQGQVGGATPVQSPIIENFACLGFSLSAAVHCTLVENVDGAKVDNVYAIYDQYGVVLKGTNSNLNRITSKGHPIAAIIVKSDSYAPAAKDNVSNCNISYLATPGDTQGLQILGASAGLVYVNVNNCHIIDTYPVGLLIQGQSLSTPVSEVNISNVTIDDPLGGTVLDGVNVDSFTANVNFDNLNVSNMTNGIRSLSPGGGGVFDNFHVSNSTFAFLTGIGIETYNSWQITGTRFSNVAGTTIQNDNSITYVCNNLFAPSVPTAYGGVGTFNFCGVGTLDTGSDISFVAAIGPGKSPIASFGACTSGLEGAHAIATTCNAACTVGGTCTTGGATHCEMYCNSSPAWVETGR